MTRPNVLVIMADDLGYSDIAPFGGEVDTPNLNRLATTGVRMEEFYVTPRCSPSRASLLTGMHPHAVGIGVLTRDDTANGGYVGTLSQDFPTIAEVLKQDGYATALIGKWHLSSDIHTENHSWPTHRGFDQFHGILPGCGSYYQPHLYEGTTRVPQESLPGDYYFTDDISESGARAIRHAAAAQTPLFLYAAYTAPHWPLHARENDIAKYRERYQAGWDELRTARQSRQRSLGLSSGQVGATRDQEVPDWLGETDPAWQVERMAVYAAQVEALDRGIGTLLHALDETGQFDNTLIVFLSDNGACAEDLPAEEAEALLGTDICPRTTRDGTAVQIGNVPGLYPGPEDTYMSYGRPWAQLSNTPFRLYKRWVHEGGIASPLIASWPAGHVQQGDIQGGPGHLVDIAATIFDAAGLTRHTVGQSLLARWQGTAGPDDQRVLCWEHIGNAAIRRGRWKLVREALQDWELYDIVSDRGEVNDLATRHTDLVAELSSLWHDWADANGVIPWDELLANYRARGIDTRHAEG